ncbi:GAF domain-containing protein [Xanthobacter flavus]|uniref:GAF domain-containing protein n=1 Tax=Xanthobacter flavus TaxID=281 RepID=UPI0037282AFD
MNTALKENERLKALASFNMLDSPRESDFDEIAELTSRICETPIAVVNFIAEHRQFFKAEVGLGVRETPLDSSFCAKAILEQEFLLVPDATQDPRFACNPLVTGEPNLRFYAGALLKTAEGHAIGTLCVLDYQPRQLSQLQQDTLKVLARQVMRQLELRQALRERDEAQKQQAILNAEITHRMKNTLAMVQAIATQTLKSVQERDAVDALCRRISAMGIAHDQLLQQDWMAASMGTTAASRHPAPTSNSVRRPRSRSPCSFTSWRQTRPSMGRCPSPAARSTCRGRSTTRPASRCFG